MPERFRDEDAALIRFGGGRNSRASEDAINELECHDGENFKLDPGRGEFGPREPFDLVATAPNGQQINGFATLLDTSGNASMLVQAGTVVYQWDGVNFTQVGTVATGAKLRGQTDAFWPLADKVLIADLGLAEPISSWDGTTFQNETFLQEDGSTAFGPFRAKYIIVENERAYFLNIHDNGSTFPHFMIGSERGNFLIVSNATRGSEAASAEDAFFLPMPQLRVINGAAVQFGFLTISQENGAFEILTGSDATDYKLDKLHRGSGAAGAEAVVATANDIVYGAQGHIESLQSTEEFGDVEQDDLSFKIADDIKDFNDWTLVYNDRVKRLYCFPTGQNEVHVAFTEFVGSQLSPWSKYTTRHNFNFAATAVMVCYDPVDKQRYTFMGDASGNLYRMEGTAGGGDAGNAVVDAWRRSVLQSAPLDAKSSNAEGWLQFRKNRADTASLKFLFAGENVTDKEISVAMPGVSYDSVYNGSAYYGGSDYYGIRHENRLVRSIFGLAHYANQWQVETRLESLNDFAITEIGIRYDVSA